MSSGFFSSPFDIDVFRNHTLFIRSFLDTEASDLPTSARTDPRVDFHGPANWFGVTTEPRPDHTTSPGADDNYNNDGGVDADDNIDDENNSSRMKASMRLRVTKLEMQHNGLAGSLPIVPLGQLAELEILNLSGQAFSSVSTIAIKRESRVKAY